IVERGRAVVAIKVKLAPDITDRDVRHLRWLRDQLGARLTAAVVITTGKAACTLEDGVHDIPAALLGP
ncbi:MAG TPA: hypothetical protein VFQ15_02295, partial [Jiangellaceae bacterium]|nr:hypothetical protein [Jiangellaceae bacterium]